MFRFFVEEKVNDTFILSDKILKHIKVARVQSEEFICIYKEKFFITKLEGNVAKIISELDENHEHDGEVVIAAAVINVKRFEWMIQKAAELGATKIIPMITDNVSIKYDNLSKKLERWNEIALNASEQSFRNKPLIVANIQQFDEVLKTNLPNKYIAHEKQKVQKDTFFNTNSIFLIGPEGGFTSQEVEKAEAKSFKTISLGKRILRAETAPLLILSRVSENS